jgi:DNA-binding transcriptional LysR family regulator
LKNHRIIKQNAPQLDDTAYARILGLTSLEGVVGIKTNSSIGVLYAVERAAGVGFLPTASVALGAPLVPVDMGVRHHTDLWITYHKEFRNSERHKIVVDWLKKIFDPRVYPCFRDEFIHPNDLVPLMRETRENFGLRGYTATGPG